MPKLYKIGLIFSLLVVAGFAGYAMYTAQNQSSTFIKETNPNLTSEQFESLERKLSDVEEGITLNAPDIDLATLYIKQGGYLHELGRLSLSKEAYLKAIEIDSNCSGAYSGLYELQIDMKDIEGATQNIQKYVDLNLDSHSRWEKYIDFHKNILGKSKEEMNGIYVQALVETKDSTDIMVAYARFLEDEMGNFQPAKEYWEKAKAQDPEKAAEYDANIARLNQKLHEVE